MISLIAAVADNNVIGSKNDLPWYLPEDLKRFRQLTTGKIVLMGSKTFDSIISRNGKPLPNRTSIVVSRNPAYAVPERVLLYSDLNEAMEKHKNDELFVMGGGEIFNQVIDKADRLYITHLNKSYDGEVFFPEIDPAQWEKTADEPHDGFSFATYTRK